jgi:hypothetical protein
MVSASSSSVQAKSPSGAKDKKDLSFVAIPARPGVYLSRHRASHVIEHRRMMNWLGKDPFTSRSRSDEVCLSLF